MFVAVSAAADGRVDFLAQRLHYPPLNGLPDDFRIRTQAALNLGATDDDGAVDPLCQSLNGDPSDVVRHADASSLKRLGRASALPCLKQRLDAEPTESVKVAIQRAIESLEGSSSSGSPGGSVPPGTHFYISVGTTTNNTTRPRAEIDALVQQAIRSKLSSMGGYAFAPPGESPDAARGVINGNNLHGYYISPLVQPFDYSNGGLKISVKLAVFTYPGKDYKGDSTASGGEDGVQRGDKSSENDVLTAVMQSATEHFAGGFH
jgi:hypothetical protein